MGNTSNFGSLLLEVQHFVTGGLISAKTRLSLHLYTSSSEYYIVNSPEEDINTPNCTIFMFIIQYH